MIAVLKVVGKDVISEVCREDRHGSNIKEYRNRENGGGCDFDTELSMFEVFGIDKTFN